MKNVKFDDITFSFINAFNFLSSEICCSRSTDNWLSRVCNSACNSAMILSFSISDASKLLLELMSDLLFPKWHVEIPRYMKRVMVRKEKQKHEWPLLHVVFMTMSSLKLRSQMILHWRVPEANSSNRTDELHKCRKKMSTFSLSRLSNLLCARSTSSVSKLSSDCFAALSSSVWVRNSNNWLWP